MRVANYIEDGRLAGPQLRIIEVAKRLKSAGIVTTVILPDQDSAAFRERLDAAEVEAKLLPIARLSANLAAVVGYVVTLIPQIWKL